MSKPKSNSSTKHSSKSAKGRAAAKPSCAKQSRRQILARRSTPASSGSIARDGTKGATIVAMLRAPAGTTIAAMMSATGWQPHSVRGFLAGVVRKKLKLNLVSEQGDTGRTYRVKEGRSATTQNELAGTN